MSFHHDSPSPVDGSPAFFNPQAETEKYQGACLPHWNQRGVTVFVTFRLADSLPQSKLASLSREKEQWLRNNPEPRSEPQKLEYHRKFTSQLQRWLDAGYGSMLLKQPAIKEIVTTAIRFFDGERYHLDEFVVAPNHVHVLMTMLPGFELPAILRSWKGFTAKQILKTVREEGRTILTTSVWQPESWDHLVRSEASLEKFRRYIRRHESTNAIENGGAASGK